MLKSNELFKKYIVLEVGELEREYKLLIYMVGDAGIEPATSSV
jgi:hypothetical protein